MAIQGMTGFGSASRDSFRVEIRSLNHRFMDVTMRMPTELSAHELPLREILKGRFERGKFDVNVSIAGAAGRIAVNINTDAAKEVLDSLNRLKGELGIAGEPDIRTLLEFKGLFIKEDVAYDTGALYDAFGEAASELEKMRLKEGEETLRELSLRAASLEVMNGEIEALSPEVMEAGKKKYFERIKELLPGEEHLKLLQEAAAIAEKADITEEVSRIKNHIVHMKRILSEGGAVGRKLDFLLQELNREANTIASKTDDYRISSLVIEMKAEIEKSREQVQNLQ